MPPRPRTSPSPYDDGSTTPAALTRITRRPRVACRPRIDILPRVIFLPLILIIALAFSPRRATAQGAPPTRPLAGESPLDGVRLPMPAIAGTQNASALETNPAGLGWLPAWSVFAQHTELRAKGRVDGTGSALFAAAPLPFYRKLVLGTALSWLRPTDAMGYPEAVKLSFGAALRPNAWVSIGLTLHTLIADKDSEVDGLTALDLGLALRPFEWFSLGVAVRNVNTPTFYGLPLARRYALEIALRPLATRRLEVGLGFTLDERRRSVDPEARLIAEPFSGLRLFAHAELLRRDFYRQGDMATDVRITAGLGFDLERLSFAFASIFGRAFDPASSGPLAESTAQSPFQGVSVSVAVRGHRVTPLVEGRRKIVVLRLKKHLSQRKLLSVFAILRQVERRPKIAGVLLDLNGLGLGWADAQELRAWVTRLRHKKKQVYAYLRAASSHEYYAVSGADRVLLDPAGGIRLAGLSSGRIYFRGLFDKIGARPQFIRIAEYKSAPETFTRKGPTAPALRMQKALLNDLFGQLVGDIARDRHLTTKRLTAIIDEGPFIPPLALSAGLVDELISPDRVQRRVAALSHATPLTASKLQRRGNRWPVGPKIAVVVIEGDIVQGKSSRLPLLGRKVVGDKTIVRALQTAQTDNRVKAIVLRINSPGGSAMASDSMWQAIRKVAKVKPVIVSMGNVAASGGYFAAAAGSKIYAMPATITGSIGIFAGKFDLSALLAKIGITIHREARGKHAAMDSLTKPYTDDDKRFILSRLRYYYDRFVSAVSQGRKMSKKAVDDVARGHVWTGAQAKTHKLVDAYGGLTAAIEDAKRAAGLQDRPVGLMILPKARRSLLRRVISSVLGHAQTRDGAADEGTMTQIIPAPLRQLLETLPPVLWRAKANAPLTRLPMMIGLGQP